MWNILGHDRGRHEIDHEISAIIVLEAKNFIETRNLRRFLICNKSVSMLPVEYQLVKSTIKLRKITLY